MRMYDLIEKKKLGGNLKTEEIKQMVNGYMTGEIPDYQMSAMLMAIYFQGMSSEEVSALTLAMANSGRRADLSAIRGIKVDKHSTGGVGDKTTLVIAPVVAACGVKVAKMCGRGLGFTGGTVDKLESIPGYRTDLTSEQFFQNVNRIGVSVIGQSADLVPADKKMYALRDVTATVNSIPLIAASVMSKKLAAGSDCILLDVTTGSGAFMRDFKDAVLLSKIMVKIGEDAGKKTVALITNMNTPLGNTIGNNLEVIEAIQVLNGKGPQDLKELCFHLAANMLFLAGKGSLDQCMQQVIHTVESGLAFRKFIQLVEAQGGDAACIEDTNLFEKAAFQLECRADRDGVITGMDTAGCGMVSGILGAGRKTQDEKIDASAGIRLYKKTGDRVKRGDALAALYTKDPCQLDEANERLKQCFQIENKEKKEEKLILERISIDSGDLF